MDISAPTILEIGVVLLAAATAGTVARRFGLPAVLGYLAVGLAISPFTPGYVAGREQLQLLADVGVVLLLFEVGIEVDVVRIHREQRALLWLAPLQMVITTVVAAAVAYGLGLGIYGAVLLGLAVAFSSSVVIVNITRSRRRTTDRETEQALLGWSLLQDVTGVALAAIVLAVFGSADQPLVVLLGLPAYLALAVAAAWVLPRLLQRLRDEHDLFLIVSVSSGLALAGAGAVLFHLPLALAAFVAGLAVTEGPMAAEARRRLLPFRDLFAVLFFVAIGTLIDPMALGRALPWLGVLLALLVGAKVVVAYLLVRVARFPAHQWQLAVGLGQMGEFSFVLASVALAAGAITTEIHSAVLAVVALSVAVSTVLARRVRRSPAPEPAEAPA